MTELPERGDHATAAISYIQLAILQYIRPDALAMIPDWNRTPADVGGWGFPAEFTWVPSDDPDLNLRSALHLLQAELDDDGAFPDQTEIASWSAISYPRLTDGEELIGIIEEMGELCRAVNKRRQGVRGTYAEWTAEIEKELGDIFIKTADVCDRLGFTWSRLATKRWLTIKQRNDSKGIRESEDVIKK